MGSPTQVADELLAWIDETDLDGFNLTRIVTPESYADFIDLVIPELQARGAYKTAYAEGSLRHKLFGRGNRLPGTHPGARFSVGANSFAEDRAAVPESSIGRPSACIANEFAPTS
ncbi:Dimethyl-sulfide monooxygenase [compost metagenome]